MTIMEQSAYKNDVVFFASLLKQKLEHLFLHNIYS